MTAHNDHHLLAIALDLQYLYFICYQYMRYEYDSKLVELFKIVIFILSKRRFYMTILYIFR